MEYILYYTNQYGKYVSCNKDDKIEIIERLPNIKNCHHFHLLKGYEPNENGLLQYSKDFKQYIKELKGNKILGIEYTKYYSDSSAVEMTFKRLCGKNKKGESYYNLLDKVDFKENTWIQATFNAGLTYFDDLRIRQTNIINTFTYDYTNQYPKLLSSNDLLISLKRGKEYTLTELPKNKLQLGYYKCIIKPNDTEGFDSNFYKIFRLSDKNVYTNYSLEFLFKHQDEYDIKIELIKEDNNAYLYDENECVKGSEIFGNWYNKLSVIKQKYKDNKLIKKLSSSLWGHLIKYSVENVNELDISDDKYDIGISNSIENVECDYIVHKYMHRSDNNSYYILRKPKDPYTSGMARIKSFLTSMARNQVAELAMNDLNNVIRIQTDGVSFTKKQNLKIVDLKEENKSTGMIFWKNVNKYTKVEKEDDKYYMLSQKDEKIYIDINNKKQLDEAFKQSKLKVNNGLDFEEEE